MCTHNNKIAWLYSYFEKDDTYITNFNYFWENTVQTHSDIDFFIIVNGTDTLSIRDVPSHAKILHRQNRGYDFAAYSFCVQTEGLFLPGTGYDYFVFMNASVTGPFPAGRDWMPEVFGLFQSGPGPIHLVGTTINMPNAWFNEHGRLKTHVQSMFFILTAEAFQFLNEQYSFFLDEPVLNRIHSKDFTIHQKEVRMTGLILHNGWNINCVLAKYRNLDYRTLQENVNPPFEDPYYNGAYFGGTIRPEDVIFFKTNRGLCTDLKV